TEAAAVTDNTSGEESDEIPNIRDISQHNNGNTPLNTIVINNLSCGHLHDDGTQPIHTESLRMWGDERSGGVSLNVDERRKEYRTDTQPFAKTISKHRNQT